MDRRHFLKLIPAGTIGLSLSGCWRIDPNHYLIRSDIIKNDEDEARILAKARVEWSEDRRVRILYVSGTPYERGYQHGKLLRDEVQDNLKYLYQKAKKIVPYEELFDESYERMRPFIPQEYVDEMHGLAHGSRLPLRMIHHIHALPEIGEWGGKRKLGDTVKRMIRGEIGTSCSNVGATGKATADGKLYSMRILDWGLHKSSKLHEYPLFTVTVPENGVTSVNVGWVGFLGAVTGMNAEGITLGEMGYGDPPYETLAGCPMPFMLRNVLSYAHNLDDVTRILRDSPPTGSFVFLMTDGKVGKSQMYVKDPKRFVSFEPGQEVRDVNYKGKEEHLPAIEQISYGGHFNEKMTEILKAEYGKISPETFMRIVPEIAMKSNFQNTIYEPAGLQLWVSNAKSKSEWAASQPYTHFDLGRAVRSFTGK